MRRRGKSYRYISAKLLISKGTLSEWFKKFKWSEDIKTRLSKEAEKNTRKRIAQFVAGNQKKWHDWREGHRFEAINEYPKLKDDPLFFSGVMLYWSEGDTGLKGGNTRLTNTDPRMIRIFIDFATKICGFNQKLIKLGLILYPDLNEAICKSFWIKQTGLPLGQFYKTQIIKGYHPTRRLEYGICIIRIGGVGLKEKIKTWIDLCANDLMRV